jgi:hypothetical protein
MAVFWVVAPCRLWLVALMMEAVWPSESLVNLYQSTRRYNPKDSHLRSTGSFWRRAHQQDAWTVVWSVHPEVHPPQCDMTQPSLAHREARQGNRAKHRPRKVELKGYSTWWQAVVRQKIREWMLFCLRTVKYSYTLLDAQHKTRNTEATNPWFTTAFAAVEGETEIVACKRFRRSLLLAPHVYKTIMETLQLDSYIKNVWERFRVEDSHHHIYSTLFLS